MKRSKQVLKEFAKEIVMFSLLTVSIVLLWRDNLTLSIVVLAECLLALGLWHDQYNLCFFLVVAVLGSVAEVVFVYFGVWQYANPTFLGVPSWFPSAFGTSALAGERLVHTVISMREKKAKEYAKELASKPKEK